MIPLGRQWTRLPWILFAAWGLVMLIGAVLIGSWIIQSGRRSEASQLAGANDPNPTFVFALTAIAAQETEAARRTEVALSATPTPSVTTTPTSTPSATRTITLTPSPTPSWTPHATRTPTRPPATRAANLTIIGYSVQGRPLQVFRFGVGPVERMLISGIHGNYEWNTIALADQLLAYLPHHPELIPPDNTLFILRSLDPDAEVYAHNSLDGRANANGVDLNRNWPSHWVAGGPRSGCWARKELTTGAYAGSEPETVALMSFLLAHHVDALINYHSAALGIFPGGQPPDAGSLSLAAAVDAVSDYPYPPIDTGCHFTGQLIDWASDNGLAALDIELTNHRDTDFQQNLAILAVLLAWRR
jgi:predicted deacylase